MNCDGSKDYIMKYFDGAISELEEVQLRQHLNSCGKCSEEFNCMKEIFTSLSTDDTVEPPDDFERQVMAKVDKIEHERRERNSKMLVLVYNAATVMSIILLMIFVADLKQVSVFNAFEQIGEYFKSFSSATAAVIGVLGDIFSLIAGVVGVIFDVAFTLVKSYYYVFVTLLAMLLAIQKLFTYVAAQDGKETK